MSKSGELQSWKEPKIRNWSSTSLPWTAKTLQGWGPWRDESLFPPPLMKFRAGRLGLRWSPTNFPGCCPIRAGCQARSRESQPITIAISERWMGRDLKGAASLWRPHQCSVWLAIGLFQDPESQNVTRFPVQQSGKAHPDLRRFLYFQSWIWIE